MQTSEQKNTIPDTQPELLEHGVEHSAAPSDQYQHWTAFGHVLLCLVCAACLSIWLMQNSVNAYLQQSYHRESPLTVLDQYPAWKLGGQWGNELNRSHDLLQAQIQQSNSQLVQWFNQNHAYTPEYQAYLLHQAEQEKIRIAHEQKLQALQARRDQFRLGPNEQMFFAGDSLMQGVAPHVQKYLQEGYQIPSINLSKQSTGLAYPKFFDWPKTIRETLATEKNIKILVVFLGPNDPWDMPNPKGGQYLTFMSPEWEAAYRSRIAEIIQTAKAHQVAVMWLGPPNMGRAKLNEQMRDLNRLIESEVHKQQGYFIDTRPLLGGKNDVYSDYLVKNNVSIKMRTADRIHFTVAGQKIIADEIIKHLQIVN